MRKIQRAIFFLTPGILMRFLAKKCENIAKSRQKMIPGSVILPYILNTICWINVTPGILLPCDPMNDHLLYLGHCDLYFMVQ